MSLTPAQALAYVEERKAELRYDLARVDERRAEIKAQLAILNDQAQELRTLTEKGSAII